ncbi:MAG: 50S ribosomal protein L22 [Patescibacteria group bacterium]
MPVKTYTNYIHIAPQKIRLVVDLIRGLDVEKAEQQLLFCKKKAASIILKSLKSAVASALHNFSLDKKNLYISEIKIGEGPSMKRWQAAAFGSAHSITKKTSHLAIVLDERVKSGKKIKKEKLKEKTEKISSQKSEEKDELKKAEKPKWFDKKEQEKTLKMSKPSAGFMRKIFRRKSV